MRLAGGVVFPRYVRVVTPEVRYKGLMQEQQEESYTVEETQLSAYETGFIAGVLAAWGFAEPTEQQFHDAMELLVAHGAPGRS